MGARAAPDQQGRARILGVERLQHVRGSMAGTAVLGGLAWQLGNVAELVQETPRVASLGVDVPEERGHLAGQRVDVRLTADDPSQTEGRGSPWGACGLEWSRQVGAATRGASIAGCWTRWDGRNRRTRSCSFAGPRPWWKAWRVTSSTWALMRRQSRPSGSDPQEVEIMTVQQSDLKLDGNAIAGLLREIFTMEMTTAESTCAGCLKVHAVGQVEVYMNAPGVVVRCPACGQVQIRIVKRGGRYCLAPAPIPRLSFSV